jgi:FixJ family two-component response regulator
MLYIIDDDQNVRDGFMMLLKSAGFKCSSFESAEEFLKNYNAGVNDLVILDMQLTGMNGCTLLEEMDKKGLHLPVIVVTAFDEPKYRECCREYGVTAYLRKPVDGEALIDLIKYKLDIQIPNNINISSQTKRSTV